jgi:transcriptional regulator with XRE-family HTH domain
VSGASIGERIDAAMRRAKVSQAELARRIGVRPEEISKWRRGPGKPRADTLRLLAAELRVTVDELLGVAAGQDPPFPAWADFLSTPEAASLDDGERRALQSLAWPPGREPTLAGYLMTLAALRGGTRPRS